MSSDQFFLVIPIAQIAKMTKGIGLTIEAAATKGAAMKR